jgi:hypothetical protein
MNDTNAETAEHSVEHDPAREPEPDNARVEKVLVLLLAGKTLPEISELVPISRTSLWRLRKTEEFQRLFKEAKAELLGGAVAALHHHSLKFVEALEKVATDSAARPGERVQASREGLAALYKGVELIDLEDRIRKLESGGG